MIYRGFCYSCHYKKPAIKYSLMDLCELTWISHLFYFVAFRSIVVIWKICMLLLSARNIINEELREKKKWWTLFHGNAYFFWYDFGFASHTWLSFEMLKINLQWGNTLRLTQSVQSSAYSFTALGQWYTCIMWRLSKKKKNCSNWRSSVCVNFMLFLTFF